jgi:hypothetical protein
VLKQLQRRGGLQACTGKDIHRLLNMVPRGSLVGSELATEDPTYYVFDHCELPSVHVDERCASRSMRMQRERLHSFLHVVQEDASIAGFRGILYERAIVIPRLQSGGTGLQLLELSPPSDDKCERAHGLSDGTLGRGTLKLSYFGSLSELRDMWSVGRDGLVVPLCKLFPAVDLASQRQPSARVGQAPCAVQVAPTCAEQPRCCGGPRGRSHGWSWPHGWLG